MKKQYYLYAAFGASLLVIGSFVLAFAAQSLPKKQAPLPSTPQHTEPTPAQEEYSITETRVKVVDPNETPTTPTSQANTARECVTFGCSGEICGEAGQADNVASICVYRPEYACFKHTKCERQASGQCGWTQNQAFTQCTANQTSGEEVY